MSTSLVSTVLLSSTALTTYFGSMILIGGLIGEILNIIVFLSLRTFRESSCAFYLILSSMIKTIYMLTGLLSRVVISAANIDWTLLSSFYCKFRISLIQFCAISSLGLTCLAVIDQYFATSIHPRWQHWSHIKIAHRLSAVLFLFCLLNSIPYPIFFELIISPMNNARACVITNAIFAQFNNKFNILVLFAPLPLFITIIFALLTYRNVQQLSYRTVPLVRRRLDQQLTTMVLVQTLFNVTVIIPYIILYTIVSHSNLAIDPSTSASTQLAISATLCIYYLYCASSFYIYVCTSERFRCQLRYVLFDIYWNRRRRRQINPVIEVILTTQQPQIIVSAPTGSKPIVMSQ